MSTERFAEADRDAGAADLVLQALLEQRDELTHAIDDQVLQYACAALQELHDIHRAQPTESLWRAIGNLHNVITRLRVLVDTHTDDRLRQHAERVADAGPGET